MRPAHEGAEARSWLKRAAADGDPTAALRLAELPLASLEAKTERVQAVRLLRTAAAHPETDGLAAARVRELGEGLR